MYLQRWHGWCHKKLLPSRCVLCTPYNHAPCHFMQSHIRKVYACLAVTCHLRFWQNDQGLLRATAVTRGWNGYQNKSQHRKLTLEKKILPLLQQGFEPATFRSWVQRSNHWAIPAPGYGLLIMDLLIFPWRMLIFTSNILQIIVNTNFDLSLFHTYTMACLEPCNCERTLKNGWKAWGCIGP